MALNTDMIDALHLKRATLNTQREPLDAEYQRIAQKKAELDARINALDLVIKEFVGDATLSTNGRPAPSETQPKPQTGTLWSTDTPTTPPQEGLKKYARAHFHELPSVYTKAHVEKMLAKARPGERINPNTLSGVMRDLADNTLARVKTAAIGRAAQVYEKVL